MRTGINSTLPLIVALGAVSIFLTEPASAQTECQIRSSNIFRYQSETITQTVAAPGPQGCYRIFRMRRGSIESVLLVSPAHAGRAAVQGFGYVYQPGTGSADSFAVRVAGTTRIGQKGFSIVRVNVLAK